MSAYRVTLTACVAGNPLKAWRDGTDPDDVWEDKTFEFGPDLDAAKAYIRGLHPDRTTHVVLEGTEDAATWEVLYRQDFPDDDLDAAGPGVVPASEVPPVPDEPDPTPEAPPPFVEPVLAPQEG